MRYHSLIIKSDQMPDDFVVTGRACDDGEVMAIQHITLPIFGLQFHPESIGTLEDDKICLTDTIIN